MVRRTTLIQLNSLLGLAAAAYAFHVENNLDDPFYEPACNAVPWLGGSCATVFKSPYGHLLSQ